MKKSRLSTALIPKVSLNKVEEMMGRSNRVTKPTVCKSMTFSEFNLTQEKSQLSCSEHSESLPSKLEKLHTKNKIWTHQDQQCNSVYSSSSDWLGQNDWANENQQRWSMATQKIKSLLAVSDALSVSKRKLREQRAMSVEQKSNFLDKFSTRDRKLSGVSFDPRRRETVHLNDGFSNGSSTELKELYADFRDSKSNMSHYVDYSPERNYCTFFSILFEPYSIFIYIWSWVAIMAINYNAWIIIFRIAFPAAQELPSSLWYCLDYTADFIYFIDILVASRISFLENGIYVDNVKRVTVRYFKSSKFILDALSLLPLDILYIFYPVNPAYRLPRLIKFLRLFQAKKLIESMTNVPNLLRGVFWLHTMFLLMHWNSCFFFIISKYEGFGSNNWVYPLHEGHHHSLTHRYVRCMYWSTLVLTTIGESNTPETTIENLYMIICYITGIFIFATIVGQAGNVIQNMNASRMEFERQRDNTMQYMKGHNVPSHLQKRVRLWYDYTNSRGRFNGGDDINEVTMLPDKMKTELALHVHLETLRKVSFLQKCQPEFLHDLVLKMKLHIFTPGDFIVRKGEIAREMYVISDGIAEVVSDAGRVLKVLRPGDFFGEIGLLSLSAGLNRRTADVRSCGYLELFVLSKDDVMSSISDYPDAQKILAKHGRKRLVLGSKAAVGPRSETTSSTSDSEIELKITRPDSEESETFFNASPDQDSVDKLFQPSNQSSVDNLDGVDDVLKDDMLAYNTYPSNYLSSPRNGGYYLGTQKQSIVSLHPLHMPHHSGSITSTRNNVIGPASSMKSLDRPVIKIQKKSHSTQGLYSSDDDRRSICERLLAPKMTNMRRSHSDMQRRRRARTFIYQSRRSVFSEGENRRENSYSRLGSLTSKSSTEYLFPNSTITNKHVEDDKLSDSEDKFLKAVKSLCLEMSTSLKKRSKNEIKQLKKKIIDLERKNSEYNNNQKQHDDQLRKQLYSKEDELRKREQEFRTKEDRLKRQLEAMEKELNEHRKRYHQRKISLTME